MNEQHPVQPKVEGPIHGPYLPLDEERLLPDLSAEYQQTIFQLNRHIEATLEAPYANDWDSIHAANRIEETKRQLKTEEYARVQKQRDETEQLARPGDE